MIYRRTRRRRVFSCPRIRGTQSLPLSIHLKTLKLINLEQVKMSPQITLHTVLLRPLKLSQDQRMEIIQETKVVQLSRDWKLLRAHPIRITRNKSKNLKAKH